MTVRFCMNKSRATGKVRLQLAFECRSEGQVAQPQQVMITLEVEPKDPAQLVYIQINHNRGRRIAIQTSRLEVRYEVRVSAVDVGARSYERKSDGEKRRGVQIGRQRWNNHQAPRTPGAGARGRGAAINPKANSTRFLDRHPASRISHVPLRVSYNCTAYNMYRNVSADKARRFTHVMVDAAWALAEIEHRNSYIASVQCGVAHNRVW